MPSWLKVLLVVCASGVLVVGLAIGGFAWWLTSKRGELRAMGLAAEADGKGYGAGNSSQACIDESLTRLDHSSGFFQEATLGIFLKSCLRTAPRDPRLCVGVPSPAATEILRTALWRNEICAAHQRPGDQACSRLLGAIQDVCYSAR